MYKQIIVVRADLQLGKGKIGAQCSHASLAAYEKVRKHHPEITKEWGNHGMMKVVLKVQSEKELFEYFQKAKDADIPCELIRDAGHTQVASGTITCFGVGPWSEEELDTIFEKLKLL